MNAIPEGIIFNSCQYTPIYLIQDPGDPQGRSYYITQTNIEEPKPVSDNLKTFYESSGNIENSVINANNIHRPRIVRKQENCVVGNNLKLASFLLPKNENVSKQQYIVSNVVTKSNVTINNSSCSTSTVNTVPRLNIDSKIVKLKNLELKTKYNRVGSAPKTKPKEPAPNVLSSAPTKLTSIQLLKLGETYHCLNQLNDEQMSKVTQALKIFSNPEKIAAETTYDPVTNTKYLYKVVSAKDLAVVGNKLAPTNKTFEAKIDNTYNEQNDKLARETVKKDLFHKENKRDILKVEQRKDLLKTELRKELAKMDSRKDMLAKSDLRKDVLMKNELKKDLFAKNDLKKDFVTKNEVKKDMLAKNEMKKDMLAKNEIKKDLGKNEMKKDILTKTDLKKEILNIKKESVTKNDVRKETVKKNEEKMKQKIINEDIGDEEMEEIEVETKVTRSGRKVKLPKLTLPEDAPHKPKKKATYVTCFQCPAVFASLYRLQKHYETHPTHIPSKIHSNLFHCLLAIVKSGSEEDRTNIFIQQLEQLIVKLKSLLPCLLKNSDSGKPCTISDDIARLLGMEPGKYNLDIEALNCVKNKDGYCHHKPPPKENTETNNQPWENGKEDIDCDPNTEDCARINSVEKWPTVNKRVWKQKKQKENAKRMRLTSENGDLIELGMEDMVIINNTHNINCSNDSSAILSPNGAENKSDTHLVDNGECNEFINTEMCLPEQINLNCVTEPEQPILQAAPNPCYLSSNTDHLLNPEPPNLLNTESNDSLQPSIPPKSTNHLQFHSTHFDIRSSPIKPSSTVFRKFQINTELLAKYEDSMRSIESVDKVQDCEKEIPAQIEVPQNTLTADDTLQEIFRDEDLSVVKESFTLDRELKDWILNRSNDEKSEDGFGKTDSIIEPALLHIRDHEIKPTNDIGHKDVLTSDNHDESSVLNFLDSLSNDCLSYPGTEIRTNNGDFQLDLFSFTSS